MDLKMCSVCVHVCQIAPHGPQNVPRLRNRMQNSLPRGSLLDTLKIFQKKCSLAVCFGFVTLRRNDNFWARGVPGPFWGGPNGSQTASQKVAFDYKRAAKVTKGPPTEPLMDLKMCSVCVHLCKIAPNGTPLTHRSLGRTSIWMIFTPPYSQNSRQNKHLDDFCASILTEPSAEQAFGRLLRLHAR